MKPKEKQLILSYLLGEIEGTAKEEFERRYFTDDSFFDRLKTTERGLINDFLHHRLGQSQTKQFEEYYSANPHRWQLVESMRLAGVSPAAEPLHTAFQQNRSVYRMQSRLLAAALAAAVVLMFGITVYFYTYNTRLRHQLDLYTSTAQLKTPTPQVLSTGVTEHLQLDASEGRARKGGEAGADRVFRMAKSAATVEITLVFQQPNAGEPYTAVLVDADGHERASHGQLSPTITNGASRLTAIFPAALLPQGSYVVRLRDNRGQILESFPFGVRRE